MKGDEAANASCFNLPIRVYIEDTDIGGVVYYANYLKFLERSRTEMFRSRGLQFRASFEHGTSYVVHSLSIDYKKSAKLDDLIYVFSKVKDHAKTYMDIKQWIENESGDLLVDASVRVACVDLTTGKPKRLSQDVVDSLYLIDER